MASVSSRAFLLAAAAVLTALPASAEPLKRARYVMGTVLEITIADASSPEHEQIIEESFEVFERYDRLISNYKPQSELSRLNSEGKLEDPSPELLDFIAESRRLAEASAFAFNPAVRPLMLLWQRGVSSGSIPSKAEISTAGRCLEAWPIIERPLVVRCPGWQMDSGGIGKGYAVDRAVERLRNRGIRNALISFGRSSTYALGRGPSGKPWRLLIQFGSERAIGEVEISDAALSASDTLGQSTRIGDREYGHIIDPRLGAPVSDKRQAVIVTASAAAAEAATKHLLLRGISDLEAFCLPRAPCWGLRLTAEHREMRQVTDNSVKFYPAEAAR